MSYNKDELVAPEWVNKVFLEKVLNNVGNSENAKVIDFETSPGTQAGDHFASIMFRIKLNYLLINEKKEMSIILKAMPHEDGLKKDLLQTMDVFEGEQKMYTETLPQCKAALKKADVKAPLDFAKLLYHSLRPHKVIVFEDLKKLGYEMLPRTIPLLSELQLIVTKLAHLHAASFKLVSEGNTNIAKIKGGMFNVPNVRDFDFVLTGIQLFTKSVASHPEYEHYANKLRKISPDTLVDRCTELFQKPGRYNVLNHGDFHIKNMMFKLNKENIATEPIFVDYQICTWGTPGIDLSYALTLNPYESRNGIIELYFNVFTDLLKKMNYTGKIPTFPDLKSELKRCRHLELFLFASVLPFFCTENVKNVDMEEMMQSSEYRSICYKSSEYQKMMEIMLPIFMEEGTLDF